MYRFALSWTRDELEANGKLHAPAALLLEKESPVPIGEEAEWDLEKVAAATLVKQTDR
jgi:hypothetical protein